MPVVRESQLREFADRILIAAGMAAADAEEAAYCLVLANLRGVDSHGVLRLTQYADTLAAGEVNARPDVRLVRRTGASALVDADGGYGFRPMRLAVRTAAELAREAGIGLVGVRASHHFGMAATYAAELTREGMIAIILTNSLPVLAPTGGADPVLGNNPMAFGFPRGAGREPIVLDMALSAVAFGRIRLAAAEGRPIPLGWGRDGEGRSTTDAVAALAASALEPIGGHKGTGLALAVELLAGALTGSPVGLASNAHAQRGGGVGHTVIAVDPGVFVGAEAFAGAVELLAAEVKGVRRAQGVDAVHLPGEIEDACMRARRSNGIPLTNELAEQLGALARRLGVAAPAWREPPPGS